MVVGVIRLDLRFYHTHSLKDKRSQVARLLGRLRGRYPVSLAEVGLLELHQRTIIGGSMTAADEASIRKVFAALEAEIEKEGSSVIIAADTEYIQYGDMDN